MVNFFNGRTCECPLSQKEVDYLMSVGDQTEIIDGQVIWQDEAENGMVYSGSVELDTGIMAGTLLTDTCEY